MAERIAIQTKTEFHEALRGGFSEAAHKACPEIWLCDADFAEWPLGSRELIGILDEWVASRRRLVLIASDFEEFARRHARFVEWRKPWSHVVECHANPEAAEIPTIMLAPGFFALELFDKLRYRGSLSHEAGDAVRCRELIDAVLQRSMPAFPVTTAGL